MAVRLLTISGIFCLRESLARPPLLEIHTFPRPLGRGCHVVTGEGLGFIIRRIIRQQHHIMLLANRKRCTIIGNNVSISVISLIL